MYSARIEPLEPYGPRGSEEPRQAERRQQESEEVEPKGYRRTDHGEQDGSGNAHVLRLRHQPLGPGGGEKMG